MSPIRTERLIIRRVIESDIQDFLAYHAHPGNRVYLPGEPMSAAQAALFLSRQAAMIIGDEGYALLAVEHQIEKKMIGEVGIYFSPKAECKGDIGWMIHPDHQRRGYATEAAQALMDYAFEVHDLHRITSGCDTENIASSRIMARLGMRREGHFLQSKQIEGGWRDEYAYAILRTEWLARAPLKSCR